LFSRTAAISTEQKSPNALRSDGPSGSWRRLRIRLGHWLTPSQLVAGRPCGWRSRLHCRRDANHFMRAGITTGRRSTNL